MNYKVLARKYRPQNFQELIGQDILVNTLKNASNDGRLAHAFLLSGIRGIGKTTTARIIAKAFNCEGNNNNKPTFDICNNCSPCNAITKGNSLDVIEIDAASKTGVDNIREIIESVMYSTNEMRFKIYIIDEVHMLSTPAFNALLKTLEEPPNNTKFIFATTEIKKIPVTIVSRCQKFNLKRIDHEVLINYLKSICDKEDITIDDESLKQISLSSEGSMRDALSILDQTAALSNNQIQITKLRRLLGVRSKLDFIKLYKFCLEANASEALNYYYQLVQDSTDPSDILNSLISICSDSCKFVIDNRLIEEHEEEFNQISKQGITKLLRSWQVLIKGLDEIKNGINQIEIVSIIIVKLCYTSSTPMPEELIKKLDKKILNNSSNQINTKTIENKDVDLKTSFNNSLESKKTYQYINKENKADSENKITLNNYEELLTFLIKKREALLHAQLINNVVIDSFEPRKISMKISENCSFDVIKNLSKFLQDKTGIKWTIEEVQTTTNKTYEEIKDINFENKKKEIETDPIIDEVKQLFPNAEIKDIE